MEEKTPLQKVVDVFNEYYGEDRVDLQGQTILIRYPKVTITNENDRHHEISELYAKVVVSSDGKLDGTFGLSRAEYTAAEWYSNYMHSHVRDIPKTRPHTFMPSCLGTGPIRDTCASLNTVFDEDIWRLFALELDKYVHTESVNGIPYKYMERVGMPNSVHQIVDSRINIPEPTNSLTVTSTEMDVLLNRFLPYVLEKKPFSFAFIGKYVIADSPYNIVVKLSNLFIEWYNGLLAEEQGDIKEQFLDQEALIVCKVGGGIITKRSIRHSGVDYNSYRGLIGTNLWRFKGEQVKLNITNIPTDDGSEPNLLEDENCSILLHPNVVMYFVNRLLRVINYRYGTEQSIEPGKEAIYL